MFVVAESQLTSTCQTRRLPTSSLQHGIRFLGIDFLTNPSPGLMLGSCLVLGCCLSSFAHRRHDIDRFQAAVFIALALWAAVLGKGIGASANMITLSLVPWALCAAMLLSFAGHGLGRRLNERRRRQGAADVHATTTFRG
jgi:4-hydroxybenzoate polyprenyltransferase